MDVTGGVWQRFLLFTFGVFFLDTTWIVKWVLMHSDMGSEITSTYLCDVAVGRVMGKLGVFLFSDVVADPSRELLDR